MPLHRAHDDAVDLARRDPATLAGAIKTAVLTVSMPLPALPIDEQAAEQRRHSRRSRALVDGLQPGENRLGLVARYERRVRALFDNPLVARPPLAAANIPALPSLVVNIPDRAAGVRQCIPFDTDERRRRELDAREAGRIGARQPCRAIRQVFRNFCRSMPGGRKPAFEYGHAVAHGAGREMVEDITKGRPAAGSESLVDVFAQACVAFLARYDRMVTVKAAHRIKQHDVDGRSRLRQMRVHNLYAGLLGRSMNKGLLEFVAGNARGIECEQDLPTAAAIGECGLERAKAGALGVHAAHDDVGKLRNDDGAEARGDLVSRRPLRVDRDIAAVLRRP